MDLLKWGQKQVRQLALNLTETELRVEEATNNDPWGPHGTEMSKISEEALDPEKYREIMSVIARRLNDSGENWRHVYKALLLLEYMVKHGPIKVSRDTQANSALLQQLQSFEFKEKNGRDQGVNVRNRAKELSGLVSDPERLQTERETARINRNKFKGASKDDVKFMDSYSNTTAAFNQSIPKRVVYEPREDEVVQEEDGEVDPFEATRKRIEKLKASDKEETSQSTAQIKINLPQKREPKKLSQVKVNPQIAATFMKTTVTTTAAAAKKENKPSELDLLGELDSRINEPVESQTSSFFQETTTTSNEDWADFKTTQVANVGMLSAEPSPPQPALSTPVSMQTTDMNSGLGFNIQSSISQPTADPFASIFGDSNSSGMTPIISGSTSGPAAPLSMKNGFDLDTPWVSSTTKVEKPVAVVSSTVGGIARGPGAPMNPNAVQPRKPLVKEDPFADLGFT